MENKEQLLKAFELAVKIMDEPVFTEEEYEAFRAGGLTEEQIKSLEKTELMSRPIDSLPDDEDGMKRLEAALEAISVEDMNKRLENIKIIAEKDPKVFSQIMALSSVIENEAMADAE